MSKVPAHKRDEYFKQNRNKILSAAAQVFGKKGFENANMSDIAIEAGISKGTLYNYFKNKISLFNEIFIEYVLLPNLKVLKLNSLSIKEQLTVLAEAYFTEVVDKHPEIVKLAIIDSPRFPDMARLVYEKLIVGMDDAIGEYLNKQVQLGKISPRKDVKLTARAFFGMLLVYVISHNLMLGKEYKPIDRTVWIEEVVDIFLNGIILK